jgi:hypothetical protein
MNWKPESKNTLFQSFVVHCYGESVGLKNSSLCYDGNVNHVAFQVVMAASVKLALFWAVTRVVWWRFTDVSDVLTSSTIRAMAVIRDVASASETS